MIKKPPIFRWLLASSDDVLQYPQHLGAYGVIGFLEAIKRQ
jgi:hypothetical protein